MATKAERRGVDGVLVLDKPLGLTSNAALQRAKRLLRAEKAGHTGTLDPLATGVLPICFGAATKLSQFALDADKRYLATLRFGITTTTGDAEGEVVRSEPASVSREALVAACARFVGTTSQVPPMHSALKKDGKPLYAYARAGLAVERAAREVEIRSLDVVDGAVDTWTIDVVCSKGTYVRTLAEDIGSAIGCGASLIALRRTATGGIAIDGAVSLEALEATPEGSRGSFLRPADCLVADRPSIRLAPDDAGRLLAGMRRRVDADDAPCVRVYASDPAAFLGIAHIRGGELISTRLLSPAEIGRVATSERAASEPHASAFAATHP